MPSRLPTAWQAAATRKNTTTAVTSRRTEASGEISRTAWVAAMGQAWGENPERGVFKTEDGGRTWRRVLYVDERTGCGDLAMDPANPDKLFAGMWQFRRWPYFFRSGGPGSGLYVSHDGGGSWKKLQEEDGLPEGDLGRIGIAVAPSDPQVVYALVEAAKSALALATCARPPKSSRGDTCASGSRSRDTAAISAPAPNPASAPTIRFGTVTRNTARPLSTNDSCDTAPRAKAFSTAIPHIQSGKYRRSAIARYAFHDWTAVVTRSGRICYQRRKINLSQVFGGQKVGSNQTADHVWLVTFMEYNLGRLRIPSA